MKITDYRGDLKRAILLISTVVAATALYSKSSFAEEDELTVKGSPPAKQTLQLDVGDKVVDTDVSPKGGVTAFVVHNNAGQTLRFWDFVRNKVIGAIPISDGDKVTAIAWHPRGELLYGIRHVGKEWQIVRLAADAKEWHPSVVYQTESPLRRLVFSTQRFSASYLSKKPDSDEFRLYFGALVSAGKWEIRTIRESGDSPYALAGPNPVPMPTAPVEGDVPENSKGKQFTVPSALPASFFRSGEVLLSEDQKGCFGEFHFGADDWSDGPKPIQWKSQPLCGGSLTYVPNGTGFFKWKKGAQGLLYLSRQVAVEKAVASEVMFLSTPSSTPDGKGVIGVIEDSKMVQQLVYMPVDIPLGDVINAWMFIDKPDDLKLYEQHGGLFRSTAFGDQLYQLYDDEAYGCASGDDGASWTSRAKRPLLITTDLFWENFGATFEAAFILNERFQAVPAFRRLVRETNLEFARAHATHRLAKVFAVAGRVLDPTHPAEPDVIEEAKDVFKGTSSGYPSLLGERVRYNQFRPRGHYAKTDEDGRYFAAMRYLTSLHLKPDEVKIVAGLPKAIQEKAKSWIDAYKPFIAAPRANLAWPDVHVPLAAKLSRPSPEPSLFPLSWARDNETFYRTTFHIDDPANSLEDRRLMPSGLDFAYVLGSDYAKESLAEELASYSHLKKRLETLRSDMGAPTDDKDSSLYDSWLNALAKQWDAQPSSSTAAGLAALDKASQSLWSAKRLQTGLSSWATLRHATILVNDQSGAAEGGQGGFSFEPLILPPPRDYVEPDPATFGALERLYAKLIGVLTKSAGTWPQDRATQDFKKGFLTQLTDTRTLIAQLEVMANKLANREALNDSEYAKLRAIFGTIEHNFLLMKSVQVENYGLAIPEPISKVADVAQALVQGLSLEVAVGKPVEWDQVVPFYGRRQLVRGSVYGYFEFTSDHPLTDDEWRLKDGQEPRPAWVKPFVVDTPMRCPAMQR